MSPSTPEDRLLAALKAAHTIANDTRHHAPSAADRLAFAADPATAYYDKVSADVFIRYLDMQDIESEIEEVRQRRSAPYYHWRNIFAVCPLILSWLSLTIAVYNYQRFLSNPANASLITQPFLKLWQDGFGGTDPLNFVVTGALDVVFLVLYLVFQILAQLQESKARNVAERMRKSLALVTQRVREYEVAKRIAHPNGPDPLNAQSSLPEIVNYAIQQALAQVLGANKALLDEAKTFIKDARDEIKGLVHEFRVAQANQVAAYSKERQEQNDRFNAIVTDMRTNINSMQRYLVTFAAEMAKVGPGIIDLNTNLKTYAERFALVGERLKDDINTLGGGISALKMSLDETSQRLKGVGQRLESVAALTARAAAAAEAAAHGMQVAVEQMGRLIGDVECRLEPRLVAMTDATVVAAKDQRNAAAAMSEAAAQLDRTTAALGRVIGGAGAGRSLPRVLHRRKDPVSFLPIMTGRALWRIFGWLFAD